MPRVLLIVHCYYATEGALSKRDDGCMVQITRTRDDVDWKVIPISTHSRGYVIRGGRKRTKASWGSGDDDYDGDTTDTMT